MYGINRQAVGDNLRRFREIPPRREAKLLDRLWEKN